MEDLSPVKWVQQVTQRCLEHVSRCLEYETFGPEESKVVDIVFYKKIFENFTKDEQWSVHTLLTEQFETQDSVLILSYIINMLNIEEFTEDIAKQIYVGNYDCFTSVMLEMQFVFLNNVDYFLRRKIHRKNIEFLKRELELNYSYMPVEKRKKNRIVIITEQLLNKYHAPTMMVLELAYIFQKYFNYEILIFTCTSNLILGPDTWLGENLFYSSGCGYQEWKYKEAFMFVYQYPMQSCTLNDYKEMIEKIYDFNPIYVLNIAACNPIADLPCDFTTVIARDTSTQLPVSEADIIVRAGKCITGNEDENMLDIHQKQVFMDRKFPVIVNTTEHNFTREELNLPDDKFLVCIVGNRLDKELDDDFMQYLFSILSQNSNIDIVIVGEAEASKLKYKQTIYGERIHFLGFCKDLLGVYRVLDLYLNPKRAGGGWSSAIALKAGLPVVTLPDCDVAYNVSENFIVPDEHSIEQEVLHYAEDRRYYEEQVSKAKKYCAKNSEEELIQYAKEFLDKIKEALPDD